MQRYLQILKEQKSPFRFLLSRLLSKSGLNKFLRIQRYKYQIKFHSTALSMNIWIDPSFKAAEEKLLRSFVGAGNTVIDVGANIGTLSLALAQKVGKKGQVHGFEPHPTTFQCFKENISFNKALNITAHNLALGKEEGMLSFSSLSDDSQNYISEIGNILVQVKPLDELDIQGPISLVKIDVEGYEPEVLLGARKICEQTNLLYLECIPELLERYGWNEETLCELIEDMGFQVFELENDKALPNKIGNKRKKMLICSKDPAFQEKMIDDKENK